MCYLACKARMPRLIRAARSWRPVWAARAGRIGGRCNGPCCAQPWRRLLLLVTLFVGGGRFATVTTEAVALSSGGQRSLLAAYALLQWLLPACMFALALGLGRKRRFAPPRMAPGLA